MKSELRDAMMRIVFVLLVSGVWLGSLLGAEERPNFVVILADDLGYGDLGCYGSERNATPHLDRMAAEGLRFTDFHSNGPMCSPTRAALMTGRYQQRLGTKFESALSGRAHYGEGLPLEATTVAESLQSAGYVTGCFGKWHLGYKPPFLPPDHGFDEFWGLGSGDGDHHTQVDRSGRPDWWHGNEKLTENGYTADLLVDHAMSFIEAHRDEPFFVYLPHLAIHFPWQGPNDPPHRRVGTDYWNDKWGIIPDRSNVRPHVKAMIEAVDDGVGRIRRQLESLNLDRRTLVVFLSDNGGYTHYGRTHRNISSNGPLRGQKTELFEGGHRVPAIAWWPGQIQPAVTDETIMSFDLVPTMIGLAGAKGAPREGFDGQDLTSLLLNGEQLVKRDLFWRMDDEGAIRSANWKWIRLGDGQRFLFDLSNDLGERRNLMAAFPNKARKLEESFHRWEERIARQP